MQLSPKSLDFAQTILKHYPLSKENSDSNKQEKDSSFQPYAHMHDHRKERQIYEKPTKQKINNMNYFKEQGNSNYREQKYEEAAYFYNKAIIYSDYTFPQTDQQQKEFQLLVQQANMNLAISLIKSNHWDQVQQNLKEAEKGDLEGKTEKERQKIENTIKKSLYWQVKCKVRKGEYEEAELIIEKLSKRKNCQTQVKELRAQLMKEKNKHQEERKNLTQKMFSQKEQI